MVSLKVWLKVAVLGLLLPLAACSDGLSQGPSPTYAQVLSLKIGAGAERAALEAEYGGKIIAWHPQRGFAVLGLPERVGSSSPELSLLSAGEAEFSSNENVFETPEVMAGGSRVWGGGQRAWSGGYPAWGGGDINRPTTFAENLGLWEQVRLRRGQDVARSLGRGIKVAIIDTGLDLSHPAFVGRLAPEHEWRDFVDDDAVPQDLPGGAAYGHGTAVADIVLQVAPRVTLLPIRVLEPDGSGDVDDVLMAVEWAIKHKADVINLSLGSPVPVFSLSVMLEYAALSGAYVASSAGNTGDQNVTYPAAEAVYSLGRGSAELRSIGVGSVDAFNRKSSFSTYGNLLELVAPGERIYAAYPEAQVAYWSGTSFSTPIVSGALALGLGQAYSGDDDEEGSGEQLAEAIGTEAQDVSALNLEVNLGKGLINVEEFLRNMRDKDD